MRQSSFAAAGNIALMDSAAAVPVQTLAFSADGRTVSFTPVQALRSSATYTLIVRGGQDGPRDEAADCAARFACDHVHDGRRCAAGHRPG